MGRFIAGEIVFLRFPFDDLTNDKSRPALVLGTVDRSRYLVAYITSQEKQKSRGAIPITQQDLVQGELRKTSYIRPEVLFTARDRIIQRKVGLISKTLHKAVVDSLITHLNKGIADRSR